MSINLTLVIGGRNQVTLSSLIKKISALIFLSWNYKRSNGFVLGAFG
jgi:hypothetical protein